VFALHDGSKHRQQSSEDPDEGHAIKKGSKPERSVLDHTVPRVDGNGQNEECRGDVSDVNEKALTEAPVRLTVDLTELKPVEADNEAQCLHQVGQGQVVDEDNILIVADEGAVMLAPSDHAVADKRKQTTCRNHRDKSEDSNGWETSLKERREVGITGRFNRPG